VLRDSASLAATSTAHSPDLNVKAPIFSTLLKSPDVSLEQVSSLGIEVVSELSIAVDR
jgi:hypothetical protein